MLSSTSTSITSKLWLIVRMWQVIQLPSMWMGIIACPQYFSMTSRTWLPPHLYFPNAVFIVPSLPRFMSHLFPHLKSVLLKHIASQCIFPVFHVFTMASYSRLKCMTTPRISLTVFHLFYLLLARISHLINCNRTLGVISLLNRCEAMPNAGSAGPNKFPLIQHC